MRTTQFKRDFKIQEIIAIKAFYKGGRMVKKSHEQNGKTIDGVEVILGTKDQLTPDTLKLIWKINRKEQIATKRGKDTLCAVETSGSGKIHLWFNIQRLGTSVEKFKEWMIA